MDLITLCRRGKWAKWHDEISFKEEVTNYQFRNKMPRQYRKIIELITS